MLRKYLIWNLTHDSIVILRIYPLNIKLEFTKDPDAPGVNLTMSDIFIIPMLLLKFIFPANNVPANPKENNHVSCETKVSFSLFPRIFKSCQRSILVGLSLNMSSSL